MSNAALWERAGVRGETCELRTRNFAERVCTITPHPNPLPQGERELGHKKSQRLGADVVMQRWAHLDDFAVEGDIDMLTGGVDADVGEGHRFEVFHRSVGPAEQ